jgi:hypothetical protein
MLFFCVLILLTLKNCMLPSLIKIVNIANFKQYLECDMRQNIYICNVFQPTT